jgi:hypothetical protein
VLFGGFYEAMREVALPLQRLSLKLLLTVNPCGAATGAVVQRRVRILLPGPPLGADPTEAQRSGELHGPHPRQHILFSAVLPALVHLSVTLILANAAELWRLLLSEAVSLYTLVTRMYVNVQVPKPRSGVTLCIHSAEDTIYIYGGYSKVSKRPTCAPVFGVLTAHEHAWSGV